MSNSYIRAELRYLDELERTLDSLASQVLNSPHRSWTVPEYNLVYCRLKASAQIVRIIRSRLNSSL